MKLNVSWQTMDTQTVWVNIHYLQNYFTLTRKHSFASHAKRSLFHSAARLINQRSHSVSGFTRVKNLRRFCNEFTLLLWLVVATGALGILKGEEKQLKYCVYPFQQLCVVSVRLPKTYLQNRNFSCLVHFSSCSKPKFLANPTFQCPC